MKMKAVCEATGLTDRTIRYYMEEELISPAYTENYLGRKTFDFSEANIEALNDIAVLRKFGFSIPEIRQMLLNPEEIPRIVNELRERKQAHIDEETQLLQALSRLNTAYSYTVPELADHLSEPVVNTPLPAEDTSLLARIMRGCGIYILVRLCMMVGAFVLLILTIVIAARIPVEYVETTDIADYANYPKVDKTDFEHQFIHSFFPEAIDDSFCDVIFSYKSENLDTYGFEAYLEFRIEDPAEFNQFISTLADEDRWKPFAFDSSFKECSIENILDLDTDDPYDPESLYEYQIVQAKIRKILYSSENQRIIFVAIGVYDGGGVGTNYLNVFFDRFDIDPVAYEQTADTSDGKGPYDLDE